MKIKIQFDTPTDGSRAVTILNRLTHDLDGKRLRAGQSYLLVGNDAKAVGMARVVREPRTTAEHAASVMQPVIDGTRQRGSVPRLRETFERMTGEQFNIGTWFRWLSETPSERMEPAIGTALAIAAAFERMQQEDAAAAAKAEAANAPTP